MVLVDFHPAPSEALVDGPQALTLNELPGFIQDTMISREAYEKRVSLWTEKQKYKGNYFLFNLKIQSDLSLFGENFLIAYKKSVTWDAEISYFDRCSRAILEPSSMFTFRRKNPPKMKSIAIERIPYLMFPVIKVIVPIIAGPITAANLPNIL